MAAPQKETSEPIGDETAKPGPLTELAHLLDVPAEDVVEFVKALLDFNDHNSARIIRGELDERDVAVAAEDMARALLVDIEAAEHMLGAAPHIDDLRLLLATLRDRVTLRLRGAVAPR